MKKFLAVTLALILVLSLCGCNLLSLVKQLSSSDLTFVNKLDEEVHNIYISSVNESEWGEPVNDGHVRSGGTTRIDFSRFEDTSTTLYDFGLICEDDCNYDVYEIPLARGDKLTLSGDYYQATLTVEHADKTTDTYEVYTYYNDD